MTDKEIIKEETVTKTKTANAPDSNTVIAAQAHRHRLIVLATLLGVVIVGLLIAAAVLAFVGVNNRNQTARPGLVGNDFRGYSRFVGNSGFGYGTTVSTSDNNGSVQTTVYTTLTGVVTAVNSNSLVIAGNGTTTTVTTNSSTTYDNGTKPAVDDTVTIAGTTSGSTTTATEVAVENN